MILLLINLSTLLLGICLFFLLKPVLRLMKHEYRCLLLELEVERMKKENHLLEIQGTKEMVNLEVAKMKSRKFLVHEKIYKNIQDTIGSTLNEG